MLGETIYHVEVVAKVMPSVNLHRDNNGRKSHKEHLKLIVVCALIALEVLLTLLINMNSKNCHFKAFRVLGYFYNELVTSQVLGQDHKRSKKEESVVAWGRCQHQNSFM